MFNNYWLQISYFTLHALGRPYSRWICMQNCQSGLPFWNENNQPTSTERWHLSYFVWEIERYCNPRAMVANEYSLNELRSLKEPDRLPLPSQLSITEGSTPIAPKASPLSYRETMRIILGVFGFAVLILERLLEIF